MITPKLPIELWNLIYNIKRAMESNDHWGWAGAVSRADITEDMCDAPYPRDRPGLWWAKDSHFPYVTAFCMLDVGLEDIPVSV